MGLKKRHSVSWCLMWHRFGSLLPNGISVQADDGWASRSVGAGPRCICASCARTGRCVWRERRVQHSLSGPPSGLRSVSNVSSSPPPPCRPSHPAPRPAHPFSLQHPKPPPFSRAHEAKVCRPCQQRRDQETRCPGCPPMNLEISKSANGSNVTTFEVRIDLS